MRRTSCPAYPLPNGNNGAHRWERRCTSCQLVHIDKPCKQPWQWNLVCACGEQRDERTYGHTLDKQEKRYAVDLDSPADLAAIIEALFDSRLDWAAAVERLLPDLSSDAAHQQADAWQADHRVQAALDSYVKRLDNESMQRRWLFDMSQKLSSDDEQTGAVRATAMNILKSILVVEKSEQNRTGVVRVEGLEKGIRKMLTDEYVDGIDAAKETVN